MGAMNYRPETYTPPFHTEESGHFMPHKNLMNMIGASIGSEMFRNLYFRQDKESVDVLEDGNLSCAVFVSNLLYLNGLLQKQHTWVSTTIKDLEESGWKNITTQRPGGVIVWGPWERSSHKHIGFSLGQNRAVSNVDMQKSPQKHHATYGENQDGSPKRPIEAVYWNSLLNEG